MPCLDLFEIKSIVLFGQSYNYAFSCILTGNEIVTDCVICYMHFMTAQQIVYGRIDQHHIVPIILELYGSFTISNYFLNVVFVTDCTRVKTKHMKAIPCYILVVLCLQVFFLCYSLIPLFHMHRIHMVVAKIQILKTKFTAWHSS